MRKQKWMLRLSALFLSIAAVLFVLLVSLITGCAGIEQSTQKVLTDPPMETLFDTAPIAISLLLG